MCHLWLQNLCLFLLNWMCYYSRILPNNYGQHSIILNLWNSHFSSICRQLGKSGYFACFSGRYQANREHRKWHLRFKSAFLEIVARYRTENKDYDASSSANTITLPRLGLPVYSFSERKLWSLKLCTVFPMAMMDTITSQLRSTFRNRLILQWHHNTCLWK